MSNRLPKHRIKKSHQVGFTLVEIAIVLVIIGLLIGGVLKGQELINSAQVRSLNDKTSGVTSAWFAFQDRYQAIPGDYTQASVNIAAGLVDGSGNGAVQGPEHTALWTHLASAGFIKGSFSGVSHPDVWRCPSDICPDNGFGTGLTLFWWNQSLNVNGNAHELITGANVPVAILAELDRKVDDGLANSGSMRLARYNLGACESAGRYNVLTPSDNCVGAFRNF